MRVVLGVGAGIAAYKACEVLRLFTEAGDDVVVAPTAASLQFVGRATWEALSGHHVHTEVWDDVPGVEHVSLGRSADLLVIAPATADLLARLASGRADDLLTTVSLTATCPVLVAPAMHTEMWRHAATQANVTTLRERGVHVLTPATGRLTGADSGIGRLPEPAVIVAAARALVRPPDLVGRTVLVTAGGTREPLDPIRFLGNRSSGRQGWALASTALARGAEVILIAADVSADLVVAPGVTLVRVTTAQELHDEVHDQLSKRNPDKPVDVVVMAAAVADYRPVSVSPTKLKKTTGGGELVLVLEQTPDVLASLVASRAASTTQVQPLLVGFAAETGDDRGDVLAHGRVKLTSRGCDLLVVNDVSAPGAGFGSPDNAAVILARDAEPVAVALGPKSVLADVVWDLVVRRLGAR